MSRPALSPLSRPVSADETGGENVAGAAKARRAAGGLTPGESEVVAIFVQMTQALGAPRSLGEIYGLLFATPRPLAFQDISERLGLSKGSVSQGLRFLRTVGAIKSVVIAGDRREHFEPVVELRALVGGFLNERMNPQLADWGARAKGLKVVDFVRANGAADPSEIKTLSGRITKLKIWQKRASTVLPMMAKLLG